MRNKGLRIVIIGASGHGVAACDAAECAGLKVIGWLDSFKPVGESIAGYHILGHPNELPSIAREYELAGWFLGISNNRTRQIVSHRLQTLAPDLAFVNIVHPSSVISKRAELGRGALVMAGAIINSGCIVREGCIINTKATLDHDSVMDSYSSILPGVTTGGNVSIGECSCICIGSTIGHRVKIGAHTYVGGGSLVLNELPDQVLVHGSPARVIRTRRMDEHHF